MSAIPVIESRGSIPYGIIVLELPWKNVVFVSVIANFLITLPVIYLLSPITNYLSRFSLFDRFFKWFFTRSKRKGLIIDRLKILGLMLFIGIPLPITGAWTGCVAAHLFGLSRRDTFIGAFLGVVMSVAIITALTNAGIEFFGIDLNSLKGE
tara:strand:- start:702 stop:1157 length:456 start_codon:yes stop_codon:yes gene_type:complete